MAEQLTDEQIDRINEDIDKAIAAGRARYLVPHKDIWRAEAAPAIYLDATSGRWCLGMTQPKGAKVNLADAQTLFGVAWRLGMRTGIVAALNTARPVRNEAGEVEPVPVTADEQLDIMRGIVLERIEENLAG